MTPKYCGSVRGYLRHLHAGTPVCDRCTTAWWLYEGQQRAMAELESLRLQRDARAVMATRYWPRCQRRDEAGQQCGCVENHPSGCDYVRRGAA